MKKLMSFILLVVVVFLSCNNDVVGSKNKDKAIQKKYSGITFVFSSKEAEQKLCWIKEHIEEIEKEAVIISNTSNDASRTLKNHSHKMLWTNEVVYVIKESNGIKKFISTGLVHVVILTVVMQNFA